MTPDERAARIAALRTVLDIAERYPDIPLPEFPAVGTDQVAWWLRGSDSARQAVILENALPCELAGGVRRMGDADRYVLTGSIGGCPVEISAPAEFIAERKVTGQRTEDVVDWVRLPVDLESGESA